MMIRITILPALIVQLSLTPFAVAQNPAAPNIVIMMADDMGFSDLGCYGSEIDTPNLDRLAAGGLRFTQFYNTARCCPTRASLLTGLYSHQAGIGHMVGDDGLPGYRGQLNRRCVTIAEVLKGAGYATYMSGKWHVVPYSVATNEAGDRDVWPLQRGFDRFFGTLAGGGSYYQPAGLMRDNTFLATVPDGFYYTDAISDNAAAFIRQHGDRDRPFFMYVAYTSPHWPLHALEEDIAKYGGRYDDGWDALRAARRERMIRMGLIRRGWGLTPRDPAAPPWENADNKLWQARRMEVYAAQIDRMDQGVGRIVTALRETGELNNTLIMFLADNGGCAENLGPGQPERYARTPGLRPELRPRRLGNDPDIMPGPPDTFASYGLPWANASNTPFRLYKHWVHEGGISSPLIVHWPAVIHQGGQLTREAGHVIDLMATCVDVAGAQYPEQRDSQPIQPMEGTSLVPAFTGGSLPADRPIFWEHEGNRALRVGKWKLVAKRGGDWELYDLESDRTELHDLADTRPRQVRELARRHDAWMDRVNAVDYSELQQIRRQRRSR